MFIFTPSNDDYHMQSKDIDTGRTVAFIALNIFGILIIWFLREFITPLLGAVIFYVLFDPWMEKLTDKYDWKPARAAAVIILITFFIVLIPVMLLSYMLYSRVIDVLSNPSSLIGLMELLGRKIHDLTGQDILTNANFMALQERVANLIPSFLGRVFFTVGNIVIMYFILFYLLVSDRFIIRELQHYLPFGKENVRLLSDELKKMTLSNAIAVPLIATVQGVAAGLGYWAFGLDQPLFWGTVTGVVSLLPIIGTALIWIPAGLLLFVTGATWAALGLLLYGVVVIVNIDNLTRLLIQKKFADVHPIITVFGVILGLNLFGLPGLIFGPLMLSYFVIFVKMYRDFYRVKVDGKHSEG